MIIPCSTLLPTVSHSCFTQDFQHAKSNIANMRQLFYDHKLRGCCDRLRIPTTEEDDGAVQRDDVVSISKYAFLCPASNMSEAHDHATTPEHEQSPPWVPREDAEETGTGQEGHGVSRVVAPGTVGAVSSRPRYPPPSTSLHDGRLFRKVG
jgi:hypothetical protein